MVMSGPMNGGANPRPVSYLLACDYRHACTTGQIDLEWEPEIWYPRPEAEGIRGFTGPDGDFVIPIGVSAVTRGRMMGLKRTKIYLGFAWWRGLMPHDEEILRLRHELIDIQNMVKT